MYYDADQRDLLYERNGIIVAVREYLIGVTAAALLCSIVKVLIPGKGTVGTVIRMLLGMMMLLAVLHPWTGSTMGGLFGWTDDISFEAQQTVDEAYTDAKEELYARIKGECEAYILAKAESMGASVEVEITLSDDSTGVPVGVSIHGAVSPYAKRIMSEMIADDLGISKEAQKWTG